MKTFEEQMADRKKHEQMIKKLTKKELQHMLMMMTNLEDFENQFLGQAKMRAESKSEPCFECKFIAHKLGFPI